MNRKYFLSLLPASLLINPLTSGANSINNNVSTKLKIPPYLVPGDTIGITCPAGYITLEELEPAIKQIKSWGFNVSLGKTVGARDFTFGGTDKERLHDFQQMLDDKNVSAIMCARGGYGVIRIIDNLNFKKYSNRPKWIIGFSDITILHTHINTLYHVASIHSKMCNSFPSNWKLAESIQIATINSIENALKGQQMKYATTYHTSNRMGKAIGELIGGNLRCIENLAGSNSEIDTNGKILFVEDTGEYLYSIDRMFYNLKRSGKLDKLVGLIIGGFKIKEDIEGDKFGKSLTEIVLDKVKEYDFPIAFDFPVGHQKANYALKCGIKHFLEVSEAGTILEEI